MEHIWQATVDSFVGGIWVGTILCAQATSERTLAGMVSLQELPGRAGRPPSDWEHWGFGALLKYVRTQGWLPDDLLDDLDHLCAARKPWDHWRRPFDEDSMHVRAAQMMLDQFLLQVTGKEAPASGENYEVVHARLLAQEALRSAVTAMRLYFGNYGRGPWAEAHYSTWREEANSMGATIGLDLVVGKRACHQAGLAAST